MIDFSDFIPFLKPAAKIIETVAGWRNTSVQARTQLAVAEKQQETQLIAAKLQYLRDRQTHDLEAARHALAADQARQLVEYVQNAETLRQDRSLEFERWRFEQQKVLLRELESVRAASRLESANVYRQAALEAAEHTKFLEHFPIQITPSTLLNDYAQRQESSGSLPLLVILSPPEIEADPSRTTSIFPHSDAQIDAVVRSMAGTYDPDGQRIRFLGGAWTSKARHGEVAIETLYSALSTIPTLVIESQVLADVIEIRCDAWLGGRRAKYRTIARIPFREMLRRPLLPSDTAALEPHLASDMNIAEFVRGLAIHHGVIAAWFADAYFLTSYQASPRLPHLLNAYASQLDPELIKLIVQSYIQMLGGADDDVGTLLAPAMSLAFAHSLAHLDKGSAAAREQLHDAIRRWLTVHGNGSPATTSFDTAVHYIASLGDLEFLLGVQQVCELLGDDGLRRAVIAALRTVNPPPLPVKDDEGDTLHDTW